MKCGGAILASTEQIQEMAQRAIAEKDRGLDVIVVVAGIGQSANEIKRMVQTFNR